MIHETVTRKGNIAKVRFGKDVHPNLQGAVTCTVNNTGNGYIVHFHSHSLAHQDHYITLDYAQAVELIVGLSAFKEELGYD